LPPAGDPEPPSAARGRSVYAFAGVARPESFLETVREISAVLVGSRFFPDHHWFTQAELDDLLREAKRRQAELLLTTEKDLVRLPPGFPAWAVRLEVKILQGADTLSHRLAVL
jgi:tetraacyldisaccharide 4'-kinase